MTRSFHRLWFRFPRTGLLLLSLALLVSVAVAWGLGARSSENHPFVPRSDSEVLEALPSGLESVRIRRLRAMQSRLDADPTNLELAMAVARTDIEESRERADPRYLGYAQAALSPWWDQESPPTSVLLLRATIRQSVHDFDGALSDLELVLKSSPDDAQAWLTHSVILTVQGKYAEAAKSCERLASLTVPLISEVCFSTLKSLQGEAKQAYLRLSRTLEAEGGRSQVVTWGLSTLAEIALRAGDLESAERHFRRVLTLEPTNAYVLGAYADLLLDLERPREVVPLLQQHPENDALLLRLAIAESRVGAALAREHTKLLRQRFEASHLRGDTVHRREESRFELALGQNARAALELARANWSVQREPWDARVLLEAALANREPVSAEPVLAMIDASRLGDPKIQELAQRVRGLKR